MRKAMLAFLALALGQTAALGQNADWANKMFSPTHQVEIVSHDFKSVPRGAQLLYRFPMKNVWKVPIEIMEFRASCGCTTPSVTKRKLEPGETGYLEAKMDTRRFTGLKTVSIYVKVGPLYQSTATVQVTANSRSDVVFNPGQINFGVVPGGQKPTQTIDVEYAGALDWQVSEVLKTEAPLEARLQELYRQPGQVGYRIHVTLKADAPAGMFKTELLLKTNDPASPLVPVLVEGNVQATLTASPANLAFDSPKVGDTVTGRFLVSGQKPFRIVSVDGQGDGLEVELPKTTARKQFLVVKYHPSVAGTLKRTLTIKTDVTGQPPLTVTVEGAATAH